MSENLPKSYNESFFSNFLRKIKMLFIKDIPKNDFVNLTIPTLHNTQSNKNNILESLKSDVDFSKITDYDRKNFMDNLKAHPDLLENFSTDRLEIILQYYLDENEEKRNLLKKLNT